MMCPCATPLGTSRRGTLYHFIFISYRIISNIIISHPIISYHITSYNVISYDIVSYHITPYHIISYHIISYHIISYHIISYRIISYHLISYHLVSSIFFSLLQPVHIPPFSLVYSIGHPHECLRSSLKKTGLPEFFFFGARSNQFDGGGAQIARRISKITQAYDWIATGVSPRRP